MSFHREQADTWRRNIPGARWFKADLHVHTIDDHPGKRVRVPAGLAALPTEQGLAAYARQFLQGVVARRVQVVGLVPHSPRMESTAETSAVWAIVEAWNRGADADGVPFREKIYAVFPGFEPSLRDGREGLHLLFLFDPEIGRDRYLKLFDVVMGGAAPWEDATLRMSSRSAEQAFDELRKFRARECPPDANGQRPWRYLVLAPHVDAPKGLLGAQKAQVLQFFDHGEVAGLEISDNKLPHDMLRNRDWLATGMQQYRQGFFHASDAYSIEDIGKRHTWMKLASPRIEALRQTFIASDSRIRIGFARDEAGELTAIDDPPDVDASGRPWLKSVRVRGGASFFGGNEGGKPRETLFELSPHLTCIIGGSMTGKSTLLDGLRLHVGAPPPSEPSIAGQVEARGRQRFLAGSPDVATEVPGSDPTASAHVRWPARFFAQNELQRLAEAGSIEELLARLIREETPGLDDRKARLRGLDGELIRVAERLTALDEQFAEAEQDHDRARRARDELDAFKDAGVGALHALGRRRQIWEAAGRDGAEAGLAIDNALASARALADDAIDDELAGLLTKAGVDPARLDLAGYRVGTTEHLQAARESQRAWAGVVSTIVDTLQDRESNAQAQVERALAARGLDSSKLREFQTLNRQAALLESYRANLDEARRSVQAAERSFENLQQQRLRLVGEQRDAFDRVLAQVEQFGDRIRAERIDNGDLHVLDQFLAGLVERGVTRWWNGLAKEARPSPARLLAHLDAGTLDAVGMTAAVQRTFREAMTKARRRRLAALSAPDVYVLELRLDDGEYRRLEALSGGQRVSVLLSLLLETCDDTPLVIDQPEDELDNRFLSETILPALKKLKGRRQIIVATHNPNIVVNGDADLVIQLEATARRGWVAAAGAIEEPDVRDAIVRTVDGGAEAFRLRRRKYGF